MANIYKKSMSIKLAEYLSNRREVAFVSAYLDEHFGEALGRGTVICRIRSLR